MSLAVGIDIGSTATKLVILENENMHKMIRPTGWSPRDAGLEGLSELLNKTGYTRNDIKKIVTTGYGRVSLDFADMAVTEITCHAKGAAYLVPEIDTIIDIGGQDSKVIKTSPEGKVLDFVMNDKCAAGTGRFLQVMAHALGVDVSELGDLHQDETNVTISNMCTVFAESEVIGLLAQGVSKEDIVSGLHFAVARRIASMSSRLGQIEKAVFTGGVALNTGICRSLEKELGKSVIIPAECQFAGAVGAALIAREMQS